MTCKSSKQEADYLEVECRSTLGLGYRSRQLCYLPQPHHGSLYVLPETAVHWRCYLTEHFPGIECQANQATNVSEECTVAWGICNVSSQHHLLQMRSHSDTSPSTPSTSTAFLVG